jgi:putative ABC transport system permease protein
MIRFLLKGLWRDKNRSRLPIIVVAIGVMLSVFMHAYVTGVIQDSVEGTAKFQTGHVKVVTHAYAKHESQMPIDLALLGITELIDSLTLQFPQVSWSPRFRFGGLVDVPDSSGETRSQGPAVGFAIDLLSENSPEIARFKLKESLVSGHLPTSSNEILLSDDFAKKLKVQPGEQVSLISSTMNGNMSVTNYLLAGTLRFGTRALDRGTLIADLSAIQYALDAEDGAGEILGFFKAGFFDTESANLLKTNFEKLYSSPEDTYAPSLIILTDDPNMGLFVRLGGSMAFLISLIFILAMSLVLWNAGLLGGLRRYGEFGVRLAIGEGKRHLYRTLILESLFVGISGTILGTAIGLGFAWLLQEYGLNIDDLMKGNQSSIMMPGTLRARITPADFYIGFFPGVLSTFIGSALSGLGIYKRQTSQLFKELE